MKKNYFGMIMTAIVMMFAGWSLTSCSEKDVSIVNGEVYEKPEVQLTDDGAIVKGSSPADISRMMSRIKTEITDAAKAGKAFKISVDAAINSTSSDNEISIPTPPDADIELSFTNPIKTEVPLTLKTKGAGDDATALASNNKVEINIPSGSSEADLELIFPTSTVTLKGGAIDELTAITATNTLIIEKGVTIEWLKMKDGRAEVKDGGKVNGYLRDGDSAPYGNADAEITSDGVAPIWGQYGPDVYSIKDEAEVAYYAKNLKIGKGEKNNVARVNINNGKAEEAADIIMADGAAASYSFYTIWESDDKTYPAKVNSIKGEGNKTAKIYTNSIGWWTSGDSEKVYTAYIELGYVKKLSNVTVDATTRPEWGKWESGEWVTEEVKISDGTIYLPDESTDCDFNSPMNINGYVKDGNYSKVTNCNLTCPTEQVTLASNTYNPYIFNINAVNSTIASRNISGIYGNSEGSSFKGRYVYFENYYLSGNEATVKNCKFEVAGDDPEAEIAIPYQTKDRSSFNFTFDNCSFGKGFMFSTYFSNNKPWIDKDGKKVTKAYGWHELEEDGVTPKYDINSNYITKRSTSEDDVPAANKANGKSYGTWSWNGYWEETNENGVSTEAYYDNYRADITFNSTTINGKTITKDTDFISYVGSGLNEKGEIATTTRFILDGVSYKAVKDSDTQKWILVAAE